MFSLFALSLLLFGGCHGFVNEVSLSQLQIDFANMQTEMGQLQQTINTLQKRLNDTGKVVAQAAASPYHGPVAFTAHLSNTLKNVSPHAHIVFDTIISNLGGAYNVHNGHFTAPVHGIYVFSLTLTNVPGLSTSLTIVKNGQDFAHALANANDNTKGQWETATIPAVVTLNPGDQVWVQNERQFTTVETLDGYNYSSFSGFLLNPL